MDPETGLDVAQGKEGEMLLQGPNVMMGYLNRPEANAETLFEDKDGIWLKTGDIAYVDKDGYWYVTDRMKELVSSFFLVFRFLFLRSTDVFFFLFPFIDRSNTKGCKSHLLSSKHFYSLVLWSAMLPLLEFGRRVKLPNYLEHMVSFLHTDHLNAKLTIIFLIT